MQFPFKELLFPMLPTIDISLIGIILAIWNVVRVIWDYLTRALNWITQRALAIFIGSKFWATAAFLVVALVIINYAARFLSIIGNYLFDMAVSSVDVDSSILDLIGLLIDGESLLGVITYCLSCWAVESLVVNLDFSRRLFIRMYTTLSQGWKT